MSDIKVLNYLYKLTKRLSSIVIHCNNIVLRLFQQMTSSLSRNCFVEGVSCGACPYVRACVGIKLERGARRRRQVSILIGLRLFLSPTSFTWRCSSNCNRLKSFSAYTYIRVCLEMAHCIFVYQEFFIVQKLEVQLRQCFDVKGCCCHQQCAASTPMVRSIATRWKSSNGIRKHSSRLKRKLRVRSCVCLECICRRQAKRATTCCFHPKTDARLFRCDWTEFLPSPQEV